MTFVSSAFIPPASLNVTVTSTPRWAKARSSSQITMPTAAIGTDQIHPGQRLLRVMELVRRGSGAGPVRSLVWSLSLIDCIPEQARIEAVRGKHRQSDHQQKGGRTPRR